MQYTTLADGTTMPMLGYGVFQIDDETTERCVADALEVGYRMVDTAQVYGNERGVGKALAASGVNRDDVFVVDKVWVNRFGKGKTYDSIRESLDKLGLERIDLMLLHQPFGDVYGAWDDMIRAKQDGLVRSIGVSNFNPVRLTDLCIFADEKPVLNQVETHVFWQQRKAHEVMGNWGVQHMSWGPFAEGANNFFHNPVLGQIGEAHDKSIGQIALRYLIDLGVVVIPKSTHKNRMEENFDVFDFTLTDDERAAIAALDTDNPVMWDHGDVDFVTPWLKQIREGQLD